MLTLLNADKDCYKCVYDMLCSNDFIIVLSLAGRGGLVVTRLPAAREDRGSRRAAGKSLCFHENHCDTQLWARAAH